MASLDLIGSSAKFRAVLENINLVAPVDSTVLIQGETGTGKELIARAIHEASSRRNNRFVSLNCAAIPSALLESELFGHERGAFTGAVGQTPSRLQTADLGTLFLDEIGDLPLELQPKLLRVIQEKQFERLGSNRTVQMNVRVIAATNQNLCQMVQDGILRADLYYRLNAFPVTLPPLRQRREDIPLLAKYFVQQFAIQQGKTIDTIPDGVMAALEHHNWPGNIRELQNVIERGVIMTRSDPVLSLRTTENLIRAEAAPVTMKTLADAQRDHITAALRETDWVINGPRGAAKLGLPATTLLYRMQQLGIARNASGGRSAQSTGRFEWIKGSRSSNLKDEWPESRVVGPAAS